MDLDDEDDPVVHLLRAAASELDDDPPPPPWDGPRLTGPPPIICDHLTRHDLGHCHDHRRPR
jgi:hypothetical protein